MTGLKRYGQVQSNTASPEQLLGQLLEAALANIRSARTSLSAGQADQARRPLLKASAIVNQLLATLDARVAPDLCRNVASVYVFVCNRLLRASLRQDAVAAEEAEAAFTPIAAGFLEAIRRQTGASR